tara:strand:+ start:602 stop:706 length:105 start_codon:yes stop_codon:yes gene_type:complete
LHRERKSIRRGRASREGEWSEGEEGIEEEKEKRR